MSNQNQKYKRGDIYFADLGKKNGSVQSGIRPVLIFSNDTGNQNGPIVSVVPLTSRIKKLWMPVHVPLSHELGLPKDSVALCEQMLTIDKSAIGRFVCHLNEWTMSRVDSAIAMASGHMPLPRVKRYRHYRSDMILTLCESHLQQYKDDPECIVKRLDWTQNKEVCTWCDKSGYDYRVTRIIRVRGRAMRNV